MDPGAAVQADARALDAVLQGLLGDIAGMGHAGTPYNRGRLKTNRRRPHQQKQGMVVTTTPGNNQSLSVFNCNVDSMGSTILPATLITPDTSRVVWGTSVTLHLYSVG